MAEFRNEDAKIAQPLDTYGSDTYLSELLWSEPGFFGQIQINVWVRNITGQPLGWVSSLETSTDGDTWTAVPGSATPVLTAAGSTSSNAQVPPDTYVRVRTVITGAEATMTGRAYVLTTPVLD